jgi:hypothetical protein
MYAAVLAANPRDSGTQVNAAQSRARLGGAYLKARDAGRARAEYREALTMAEPLGRAPTSSMAALYTLADTYAGLGDVSAFAATNATRGIERSRESRDAQTWYAKSLHAWQGIHNPAHISPKGFPVTDRREVGRRARVVAGMTAVLQ